MGLFGSRPDELSWLGPFAAVHALELEVAADWTATRGGVTTRLRARTARRSGFALAEERAPITLEHASATDGRWHATAPPDALALDDYVFRLDGPAALVAHVEKESGTVRVDVACARD